MPVESYPSESINIDASIVRLLGPAITTHESKSAYPLPTQEHLASLHALTDEIINTGDFGADTGVLMHEFVDRHDIGYAVDSETVVSSESGQATISRLLEGLGGTVEASVVTDYIISNKANFMASTVIGHGLVGVATNTDDYIKQGMDPSKAFGLSVLFAAHHPGFPIDMVSGFLKGSSAEIPLELRAPLLIDQAGQDAEGLRAQLTEIGARALGIDIDQAAKIVSLGYGLDRMTAGRTPDTIEVHNEPQQDAKGNTRFTTVVGGEVIQKKYGLVAGDLRREAEQQGTQAPTVEILYATVIERLIIEAESAVKAAEQLSQPDVAALISEKTKAIIATTKFEQDAALRLMKTISSPDNVSVLPMAKVETGVPALTADELSAARSNLLAMIGPSGSQPEGLPYALATLDTLIATQS